MSDGRSLLQSEAGSRAHHAVAAACRVCGGGVLTDSRCNLLKSGSERPRDGASAKRYARPLRNHAKYPTYKMPSMQIAAYGVYAKTFIRPKFSGNATVRSLRRMAASMDAWAPRVKVMPAPLEHCNAEWIATPHGTSDRVLLYLPGGGFIMRTPRTSRHLAAALARTSRARAQVVFYRLAPEHPFPAGLDDCIAAYERLLTKVSMLAASSSVATRQGARSCCRCCWPCAMPDGPFRPERSDSHRAPTCGVGASTGRRPARRPI